MQKFCRSVALLFVAATLLPGCSMLTAQGRQQRAYEHYVRKSSLGRAKQQKRMSAKKDSKIPVLEPTEPMEATELSGPESASSGSY